MILNLETLKNYISLLPEFTVVSMVEILIISFIVFRVLKWILDSKAWTLLKGIGVIILFALISYVFHLTTILWLLERVSTIAVIVLVVIFQPELRKALEQLGSQSLLDSIGFIPPKKTDEYGMYKETAAKISSAVFSMARVKTGALIVIEQNESLNDFIQTGIRLDAEISTGLIINIFEKNTPLHDGAVIIKGNRIIAATCYLPLSDNQDISKDLGTRHRAGIGMSEVNDSISIIVSEETGRVSVAHRGRLQSIPDEKVLERILVNRINKHEAKWFDMLRKEKTGGNDS